VKIYRIAPDNNFDKWRDWYVITIAKSHNAALEVYAWGLYRVDVETIEKFSAEVNDSYTANSLYPKAPVSAVPLRYFFIMGEAYFKQYIDDFRRHMKECLEINRTQIHAKKILIDFHRDSNNVWECYLAEAEKAMEEFLADDEVDEVALIK
jgi:hypothetical protein